MAADDHDKIAEVNLQESEAMMGEWRDLVADIKHIRRGISTWENTLDKQVNQLRSDLNVRLDDIETSFKNAVSQMVTDEIEKFGQTIKDNIDSINSRVEHVENRFDQIEEQLSNSSVNNTADKTDRSIIIRGFSLNEEEDIAMQIQDMLNKIVEGDCVVMNVERGGGHGTSTWLKAELATVNQKIAALQGKSKLSRDKATKRVFIDKVKSPIELTLEHNSRMLLKMMGGSGMRVAGNSRIVKVSDNAGTHNHNNVKQTSPANSGTPAVSGSAGESTGGVEMHSTATSTESTKKNTPSSANTANQPSPSAQPDSASIQRQPVPASAPIIVSSTNQGQNQGFSGLTQGVSQLLGAAAATLGFSTPSQPKTIPPAATLNASFIQSTQDASDSVLLGAVGGLATEDLVFNASAVQYEQEHVVQFLRNLAKRQ